MNKIILKFLLTLSLLICCYVAIAQSPVFRQYTVNDGLPSSEVYRVIQDSKGYMWFATDRGVSRFDGYKFETFGVNEGLPDNTIFHLFEDYKKRIWFISFSSKLSYYENGEIHLYKYNDSLLKQIKYIAPYNDFYVDSTDAVYYSLYYQGGFRINKDGNVSNIHKMDLELGFKKINKKKLFDFHHVSKEISKKIAKSNKGALGAVAELLKYSFTVYNEEKEYRVPLPGNSYAGNIPIFSALKREDTFFYSYNNIVYYVENNKIKDSVKVDAEIHFMDIDKNGGLWLGLQNKGALYYEDGDIKNSPKRFFENEYVTSVFEDNEKGYWITTLSSGVYYMPALDFLVYNEKEGIESLKVDNLEKDGDGNFWFNDLSSQVYSVKSKDLDIKKHPFQGVKKSGYINSITYNPFINQLFFGRPNPIILNLKTMKFEPIESPQMSGEITPSAFVFDKNGLLYVASASNIATYKKAQNGKFYQRVKSLTPNFRVDAMIKCDDESLWLGNVTGLWQYKDEKKRFLGDDITLFKNRVTCLEKINKSDIAIGTKGGGVIIYDGQTIKNHITTKNGLPSNTILDMYYFNKYLWVGTNAGIAKINLTNKQLDIEVITVSEGLSSNEVNSVCANDSLLFAATNQGLNVINYIKFKHLDTPIPVYVKKVKVNDKDTLLVNGYELKHHQNTLSFDFAGLSYKAPGKLKYRYKLLGTDTLWHEISSTQLRFPNLPPAQYELTIQASITPGIWNSTFENIKFAIIPAITDRWWFKLMIVVAVIVVIVVGFVIRIRQIRTKNKLEEDMNSYRMQALSAQMNPHFIFNSLNSIQNYILQNDKKESNKYLAKFSRLMRMVFDNSQKTSVLLSEEVESLTNYIDLEVLRYKNKFSYSIEIDDEIEQDLCLVPPLILQPFVENAIWHGFMHKEEEGHLEIVFKLKEDKIIVSIQDDGVGREKAKEYRMANKPEHKSGGLAITQKRIEIINRFSHMQSVIKVIDLKDENGQASGTRIEITLPYITNKK